jgi:hypothetical protein
MEVSSIEKVPDARREKNEKKNSKNGVSGSVRTADTATLLLQKRSTTLK